MIIHIHTHVYKYICRSDRDLSISDLLSKRLNTFGSDLDERIRIPLPYPTKQIGFGQKCNPLTGLVTSYLRFLSCMYTGGD